MDDDVEKSLKKKMMESPNPQDPEAEEPMN